MRKISHSEVQPDAPRQVGKYWLSEEIYIKYWGRERARVQQVFEGHCGNVAERAFVYPQMLIWVMV